MDPNHPPPPSKKVAVFGIDADETTLIEMVLTNERRIIKSALVDDFIGKKEELESFITDFSPNIIFWSVGLPFEDKWNFFKETTDPEKPCMKGKKVVILTGVVEKDMEQMAAETKDTILRKPYNIEDLIRLADEEPDQELNHEIAKETHDEPPYISREKGR